MPTPIQPIQSASQGGAILPEMTLAEVDLHTDALGSPVAETDESCSVLKRTRYEPYGAPTDGIYVNGPGFTGHVTDAATGLTYMQQRYYDPLAGRFLSL
ncbi:MAG: RHS repeat-associated core domain-containing protein [Dokdonella sp.]